MFFSGKGSGPLNVALIGLLFAGCVLVFLYSGNSQAPYTSEQPVPLEGNFPEKRILFVGNSYTFFNDMPIMVQNMLNTRGGRRFNYRADMIVRNAAHIVDYLQERTVLTQLANVKYDYVVLQEQSTVPFFTDEAAVSQAALGTLIQQIRQRGVPVALFSTWARKPGNEFYSATLYSNFARPRDAVGMSATLHNFYKNIAARYGADYIPLAAYWLVVLKNHPEMEMYIADGSHPSKAGSYLMALSAYRCIAGSVPEDVWHPSGVSEAERKALIQLF